ncbi:MAG: YggT family protein [Coriobacteriales bacterium]
MTVVRVISTIVNFYVFLIIIYVLLSWFPHDRGTMNDVYRAFEKICEPYLGLFRKIIPAVGGIDFSPVVAVVVLELVVSLVTRIIV